MPVFLLVLVMLSGVVCYVLVTYNNPLMLGQYSLPNVHLLATHTVILEGCLATIPRSSRHRVMHSYTARLWEE
jgi:hypothetical protein